METDSDSDGSHISATPPRDPKPPPSPSPPQPRPRPPTLLSSNKCRTRVKASSRSNPISKPKSSSKPTIPSPKPNHKPSQPNPPYNHFPPPHMPFPILRPSDQNHAASATTPVENLPGPARHLSKVASFLKIRKPCLNFDPIENDPYVPSVPNSHLDTRTGGPDRVAANGVPLEVRGETFNGGNSVKFAKKHPNLIGGSVDSLPVKRPKCVSEGNFVRLNINGYGHRRKFMNKGSRKNQSKSGGKRYFKRNKRKLKAEGEAEEDGLCDEDGLVWRHCKGRRSGEDQNLIAN
ncbi:hypothetical protein L1049_006170 [Liquidambar formosana]|uniref:Uncharacterized protein n=1 Tax=Liquidambar formosana TaxID=63359 RepID=A0AAP0RF04_LIQFO